MGQRGMKAADQHPAFPEIPLPHDPARQIDTNRQLHDPTGVSHQRVTSEYEAATATTN